MPAGKKGADAEAQRVQTAAKFHAKSQAEAAGLEVIDPAVQGKEKKKPRLADAFDDYIEYEFKRGALEAREQAILVKAEFLKFVPLTHVAEVTRDRSLPSTPSCVSSAVPREPSPTSASASRIRIQNSSS